MDDLGPPMHQISLRASPSYKIIVHPLYIQFVLFVCLSPKLIAFESYRPTEERGLGEEEIYKVKKRETSLLKSYFPF